MVPNGEVGGGGVVVVVEVVAVIVVSVPLLPWRPHRLHLLFRVRLEAEVEEAGGRGHVTHAQEADLQAAVLGKGLRGQRRPQRGHVNVSLEKRESEKIYKSDSQFENCQMVFDSSRKTFGL